MATTTNTNSTKRKDQARKAGKCQLCGTKTKGHSVVIDYDKEKVVKSAAGKAKAGHAFYCTDCADKKVKRYEWKLERRGSAPKRTRKASAKKGAAKAAAPKKARKATTRKATPKGGAKAGEKAKATATRKRTRKGTAAKPAAKKAQKAAAPKRAKKAPAKAQKAQTAADPF